jgi:Tfp pilus assembly protein PilN
MSQQINLYNPLFLKQRKYFSATTMFQALGLIAAGSAMLYAYAVFQGRELQRLSAEMDQQLKSRRDQMMSMGGGPSPQGRSKLLEDEIARLEARLRQREDLLANMHVGIAGPSAGFSPYLTALARQTTDGVWLTGVIISGSSVVIKGRALDADRVPAYIRALNREAIISGRQILELALASREEVGPALLPGAPAAPQLKPAAPSRYVEFSMSLSPRRGAAEKPASKEAS